MNLDLGTFIMMEEWERRKWNHQKFYQEDGTLPSQKIKEDFSIIMKKMEPVRLKKNGIYPQRRKQENFNLP